jgi:predicted kinase
MKKVVIMRGAPGFGKSTYVKKTYPAATVASADHYFERKGKYEFNKFLLGKAHNECQKTFSSAIERGDELIVLDNTNVKVRDFKPYVEEAKAAGYEVEIVRLDCDVTKATARGVHAVPGSAVERMAESLRTSKLPEGWTETVVKTDADTDEKTA